MTSQSPTSGVRGGVMRRCRTRGELDTALEDAGTALVVLYFTAPWDRPSSLIGNTLDEVVRQQEEVIFLKVITHSG